MICFCVFLSFYTHILILCDVCILGFGEFRIDGLSYVHFQLVFVCLLLSACFLCVVVFDF